MRPTYILGQNTVLFLQKEALAGLVLVLLGPAVVVFGEVKRSRESYTFSYKHGYDSVFSLYRWAWLSGWDSRIIPSSRGSVWDSDNAFFHVSHQSSSSTATLLLRVTLQQQKKIQEIKWEAIKVNGTSYIVDKLVIYYDPRKNRSL